MSDGRGFHIQGGNIQGIFGNIPYSQGNPSPLMAQRPTAVGGTPNFSQSAPYKFAGFDSAQKFPNAKEKLHNILQGAVKGHKLGFASAKVPNCGFWRATLQINWPQTMSFCGEGWEKRDAENRAAALACVELQKQGFSKGAAKVLKEQEIGKGDEPTWINVNDYHLSMIESFLRRNSIIGQQYSASQRDISQRSNFLTNQSYQDQRSTLWNQPNLHHTADRNQEYWRDNPAQQQDGFVSWGNQSEHLTALTAPAAQHSSKSYSVNQLPRTVPTSANTADTSCKVKDIFTGSLWQPLSSEEQVKLNTQLLEELCQRQKTCDPKLLKIKEETGKLPVASMRCEILDLILKNRVVVLSGETGCGKTTQIPQYILDQVIQSGHGSTCNIVVTQPRRIVAMSIAERVACERGEELGKSVGYQVRLQGTPPTQQGRILFCTTGILLRRMQNNALLQGVSHVIVDEVHERDINTDIILILLKDLLDKNPSIKIIVMSATVNADRFCRYFHGCPSLTIPGFTHSVTEYFLSDIHDMLSGPNYKQNKRMKLNSGAAKLYLSQHPSPGLSSMMHKLKTLCIQLKERSQEGDPDADVELVSETILHVCSRYPEGAILCFLAGWDEITMVSDILMTKMKDKSGYLVLPLHSMLPSFHQHAVFDRPPTGVRKIVLATNIAETSITIDDVVYVINAGNLKEKMYDTQRKVSCLMTHWTSKASAVQRRGRAGRCKPGFCFNLFTRQQFENMAPYQPPEILRISLEEIVLQTKLQCRDTCNTAQQFLSKALDPPSTYAVHSAISSLKEIGALDEQENLTVIGRHMAFLPVEPRIAKMIIYGAIFRCLDPVLTIAASLSYKDPFVAPLDKRDQADMARRRFSQGSLSDHVAVLNAFNGWLEAESQSRGREYVDQQFLHWGTLNMIRGMRDQFYRILVDSGLLPRVKSDHVINAYSGNLELVKAILCAGLFPNVVKVGLGIESKGRSGKKRMRICLRTKTDGRVFLHPSSVNCDEKQFRSRWLVYHEKVKSSHVFIRDSSMVRPVALVLFAGKHVREILEPGSGQSRVTLTVDGDRWISFYCSARLAQALLALRGEIRKMVSCNVSTVSTNDSLFNYHTELLDTVSWLLDAPAP